MIAPHRLGQPNPLTFHLGAAAIACQQAILAAPNAGQPDFPWHDSLRDAASRLGPLPDSLTLATEAASRLRQMLDGVAAWQSHPYRRQVAEPEVIWQQGSSRLLDYGAAAEATAPNGPPVLVIPSLINRAYILDLSPDRSLLRHLARQGLRPLLLDWGAPGFDERGFDFAAYAEDRLLPALAIARALSRRDVALLGYCMGGTLATGLAASRPQGVAALVTLGAPWSFTGVSGIAGLIRGLVRTDPARNFELLLNSLAQAFGLIPVDLFQLLFAILNPVQAAAKFRRFAALDPASPEAWHFAALEDWIADGVPMAAPAARNLLIDWQVDNQPQLGNWKFLGGYVNPGQITIPALHVAGASDHIAPPASTAPLASAMPQARTITASSGHVGMIVGSAAPTKVWQPVADFLLQNRA